MGIAFGPDVTRKWCELNKVTGIFRSHEVRANGYAIEHDGLCITVSMSTSALTWRTQHYQVFSAPNYVDQSGNKGAFVRIWSLPLVNEVLTLPAGSRQLSWRLRLPSI